jgi:hypothetical protein
MAVTPVSPSTGTVSRRFMVVPSPICPASLSPAQCTVRSLRITHPKYSPAASASPSKEGARTGDGDPLVVVKVV